MTDVSYVPGDRPEAVLESGVRTILVAGGEASKGVNAERVAFTPAAQAVEWMLAS